MSSIWPFWAQLRTGASSEADTHLRFHLHTLTHRAPQMDAELPFVMCSSSLVPVFMTQAPLCSSGTFCFKQAWWQHPIETKNFHSDVEYGFKSNLCMAGSAQFPILSQPQFLVSKIRIKWEDTCEALPTELPHCFPTLSLQVALAQGPDTCPLPAL
jgi:hypothetical protein